MSHLDDPATQRSNLKYIKSSMREPMLVRDDEFELARRWREHGDEKALHELVRSYARLVISTATRFRHYGLPIGDLMQEGNVGLMQAAARFEADRDVRFSTYATWWIRSAIQDYVLRHWSIVRTGTTAAHKSLFFNFRRLRSKLRNASPDGRLDDEGRKTIAFQLGVSIQDVVAMEIRLSSIDQSLNVSIGEDGDDELQNFLPDNALNPEEAVIEKRDTSTGEKWLFKAMHTLSDRERIIIRHRRLRDSGATLDELGKTLGVSKERVRQIENRALGKLKSFLEKNVPDHKDLFVHA